MFPPEDTSKLYPSRIPYEESSVFSRVNILRPDLGRFPAFRHAGAHVVTLLPGQVARLKYINIHAACTPIKCTHTLCDVCTVCLSLHHTRVRL